MTTQPPILLAAAWLAPMNGPLIRDGAIVFENDTIIAVGNHRDLRRAYPQAIVEELPDAILLPGLINAHAHLELSDLSSGPQPTDFVDWLMNLISQTSRWGNALPQRIKHAVQIGVAQCLRFGVTTVGDISKQCMFTRPVLRDGPLRVISYGEIQAMAKRRNLFDERLAAATDTTDESDRLHIGISPHAPYTVEPQAYQRSLAYARQHHRPIATHLAETPQEATFLSDHTGPFRRLWEVGVNAWDDHVPRFEGGPIRFAKQVGLLDYPTLLAHVNYCDDDELKILAAGQASVVYCPRTHAYFGHPPHRWRDMLSSGINVAVGTDSCASSPNLNLLDDLRLLHRIAPEVDAIDLWQMATARAARALNLENTIGGLEPGKRADIVAFSATGDSPLITLLESDALPLRLYIDGTRIPTIAEPSTPPPP